MHIDILRTALSDRPFRPFVLETAGGRERRVSHPQLVLILPGARTVFVVTSPHSGVLLDTITIGGIHHGKGGSNGSSGKKKGRRDRGLSVDINFALGFRCLEYAPVGIVLHLLGMRKSGDGVVARGLRSKTRSTPGYLLSAFQAGITDQIATGEAVSVALRPSISPFNFAAN
jgi:hypothetical protein